MGRAVPMINILYVACHIYDIDDAELKQSFLYNVPFNHAVLKAWSQVQN